MRVRWTSIPVTVALFDIGGYTGGIVSDRFRDDRYFADAVRSGARSRR